MPSKPLMTTISFQVPVELLATYVASVEAVRKADGMLFDFYRQGPEAVAEAVQAARTDHEAAGKMAARDANLILGHWMTSAPGQKYLTKHRNATKPLTK